MPGVKPGGMGGDTTSGQASGYGRNLGKRSVKTIGFYLRDAGNLHYFASIQPYLDRLRTWHRCRTALIVRSRSPENERAPVYEGYRDLFTTDCDLDGYDLILTPTFLRPGETGKRIRIVQIFHGMSDKPFTYERNFSRYELCLCAGKRQVDRLVAHTVNSSARWKLIGYPKFDNPLTIPRLFDNDRKTVIYCPTWRKQGLSSIDRFLSSPEAIAAIADTYNLIVKPHPNIFNPSRDFFDRETVDMLERTPGITLVHSGNVMPFFDQADLFVGDISASGYEWLYFDRPMVFLNPQPDRLRADAKIDSLTYLWQCGEVCNDIGMLKPMIDWNMQCDAFHARREAVLRYSVLEPRENRAVARGVDAIKALLPV